MPLSLSGITSKGLRRQSGFTLIELMVVMAIIAILATAGLSAYTGYIKKARDATRIADLRAIDTVIQSSMTTSGTYPDIVTLRSAISAFNNGQLLLDPMKDTTTGLGGKGKQVCISWAGSTEYKVNCNYFYQTFDSRMSYRLGAFLESSSSNSLVTGGYSSSGYSLGAVTSLVFGNCMLDSPPPSGAGRYYSIQNCTIGVSTADASAWDNTILL